MDLPELLAPANYTLTLDYGLWHVLLDDTAGNYTEFINLSSMVQEKNLGMVKQYIEVHSAVGFVVFDATESTVHR